MPNNFIKKINSECKIPLDELETLWKESEDTAKVTNTNNYGLAMVIFKRKVKKHFPECSYLTSENYITEKFKHWPLVTEYVILFDNEASSKLRSKTIYYNWKDLTIFILNNKDITIRNIDKFSKNKDYIDITNTNEYEGKNLNSLVMTDKSIYEKAKKIFKDLEIDFMIYINNKRRVK